MRSLSRLPLGCWFATLTAFTVLLLASASTDQVLGGEDSRFATGWPSSTVASERVLPHRRLAGPGSSPPNCTSKCGSCSPCERVLVTVPPGRILPSDEYRPKVWRCKCGDKIYIP